MRVLEINGVPYGSTGKIMYSIADILKINGDEVLCATGFTWKKSSRLDNVIVSTFVEKCIHIVLAKITGLNGLFSYFATWRFLRKVDKFKPDLVHLHNLHGWFICLPMLFSYINRKKLPTVWTLHDCWSFTGQCSHFTMIKCEKWKTGCYKCPQYKSIYPKAFVDNTKKMWKLKKKWFTGVENLTIVTPSRWLELLVKESYLRDYPIKVINNGIELSIFKPTASSFRTDYNISEEKYIILGVAIDWGVRKGLDVFINLSKSLGDKYQIVLVGTNTSIDTQLPSNIISIHRTQNQNELAQIYSVADLFINPTREDNYPTVNIEALACGTPVITFRTGGSPEAITNSCGVVVELDDFDGLKSEIIRVTEGRIFGRAECLKQALELSAEKKFEEYISLYKSLLI